MKMFHGDDNGDDFTDSEEKLQWLKDAQDNRKVDQSYENDTYICYLNDSRKIMKKGSQASYCYGNRTNFSLMITYGFCYKNNRFDSVKCRFSLVNIDI